MSVSLPPTETLSIILDEPSLCNQTITFGEDSMEVNRFILAAHSTYFQSLWFMKVGGSEEELIDFSHLPVRPDNFFRFIKSFFGISFTLNESNSCEFYYLVHYFQVDKLIVQVENQIKPHFVTWAWLKPFIKEADQGNDLQALEFAGPFFSKVSDLVVDDVMAITTEGLLTLSKYCTSTQSQSWFIKSMVVSLFDQNFDLTEFLNILNSCSIEALSFQQWDEFLFVPLKDVAELEADLMEFLFTRVKNLYFDSTGKKKSHSKPQNSGVRSKFSPKSDSDSNVLTADLAIESQSFSTEFSTFKADISQFDTQFSDIQGEIETSEPQPTTTAIIPQSNVIRFSQIAKHCQMEVSDDQKTVFVVGSDDIEVRNILGDYPLLPGHDYTWKLRYQGNTDMLFVGVIDESEFSADGYCSMNAHCFVNHGSSAYGCLSGSRAKWNLGELLEINANLIDFTLTIKSVSDSSINLTGTLPILSIGNYYPFAFLYCGNHVLEIVE
ncbi:hypothetical protein GEMRC1_000804 [Eukaryota sp. GEM-RC1]